MTQTTDPRAKDLSDWLMHHGLVGTRTMDVLNAYCDRLVEMGVSLFRFHMTHNALHPVYGAVGFDWQRDSGTAEHAYARQQDAPDTWYKSPFYYMLSNELWEYREKIGPGQGDSQFPLLRDMAGQGAREYFAQAKLFYERRDGLSAEEELQAGSEGAMASWMSYADGGFTDAEAALIRETFPLLCLVIKSGTNRKTAHDLLGVYLGRDAGQRVLRGDIQRGSSQWIDAVICYFDLQGFTNMSQQIEGEALIAMLNDYFGAVVSRIEAHQGDVLKFMGDGLIAIFDRAALPNAIDHALQAVVEIGDSMAERNLEREAAAQPTLGYTVALHAGRVLYGNIGADERLDFTVIGPEMNLAARLADMHRPLGRNVILSEAAISEVVPEAHEVVSLGRYMLRGVAHPLELFTLHHGEGPLA